MKAMKALLALGAVVAPASAVNTQDKTITQVVKLLQHMLATSKEEGETDTKLYAKFKCYCDDNEVEKRQSIEDSGTQISIMESKISETQGSTGQLSTQCAKLKSDLFDNEQAQATAESVRNKESEAFIEEEADMKNAIDQMDDAITTLAAVGADQTLGDAAADNAKFMAGFEGGFLQQKQKSQMQKALATASVFLTPSQQQQVTSFMQGGGFTGSYSSQSGQVVGILKSMRDTFKANLADARTTEKSQFESNAKLMTTLKAEHKRMTKTYDLKQEELGTNDDSLSDYKEQLSKAKDSKAEDEEFLQKLLVMCEDKAKQYQERAALRTNEDAAVAEAISILNSDEAFDTFGKQAATSTGATGFLQLQSVHAHHPASLLQSSTAARMQAKDLLMKAAGHHHSMRLSKVAFLLQKGNPFKTVLKEITKMLKVIVEEGKADKENLDWCNDEREENVENLGDKNDQIGTLKEDISQLTTDIEDPASGVKVQIENANTLLKENIESQKTQTSARTDENLEYQSNIKNLVKAEEILKKAIKALRRYYDKLEAKIAEEEGGALLQSEPSAPDTFGNYRGGSEKGGDAITMIEFILEETIKEETESHSAEEAAQHAYEDSMAELKLAEEEGQKTIVDLKATLAEKEKTLAAKEAELKDTTDDKEAIESYLLKIKPGCDFITENFDLRETNRATETGALENAQTLLKDTPAYKAAEAEAHTASLGECVDSCENEAHVECKSCMAGTSIPGYCAGHSDTEGC